MKEEYYVKEKGKIRACQEKPAGDLPWEELLSLTKETLSRLSATAQKALDEIPPKLGAEPGDLTTGRGRWERHDGIFGENHCRSFRP